MRIRYSAIYQRLSLGVLAGVVTATLAATLLTGCGLGNATTSSSTGTSVIAAATPQNKGSVYGGQQPVSGATIQLYTVGTAGAASASTALITSTTVTTNSGGGFTIPAGAYSCTSPTTATEVYIVASGGNAGSGNNSALTLMAALGPCGSLNASTFVNINELTTVAAVYALAPFMATSSSYSNIGATGSYPTGLVNAFAMANQLVSSATGQEPAAPAGMTIPTSVLNTLANILASCVNSTGPSSTTCTSLLSATGASETIGAGLAIAKNPGSASFTSLYALASSTPPFEPALATQPNDFTVALHYSTSALSAPYGIAIDASGNAWVTNEAGTSVVKAITPTVLTSSPYTVTPFSTSAYSNVGLLAPRGISIDRAGNIWIANTGYNNVVELSSLGSNVGSSPFSGGGIAAPISIANDSAGNAWIANFSGNSITELNSSGAAQNSSPVTGSGSLSSPSSIALDVSGNVYVANAATGEICEFNHSAVLQSCPGNGDLFGSTAVAVTGAGNAVLAGSTSGPSLTGAFTLLSSGSVTTSSPIAGGGLSLPAAVAYDGAGYAWFANTSTLSEFSGSTALSPSTGYGSLNSPSGIAIDPSGNVWAPNVGDNSISIFVGLATPVATPLSLNVGP